MIGSLNAPTVDFIRVIRGLMWTAASCSLVATCACFAAAGEISTIAGSGNSADGGTGGPATKTNIGNPFGVEFGPDGALYICEVTNHRVRKLDLKTGQLTTVAGCGRKGYAGDGGPATEALLNEPYEVRFDRQANMYFVEMQNHLIRRVDAKTGKISTVAGTGEAGFSGDGGPATKAQFRQPHSLVLDEAGAIYVADIGNHRIRRVDPQGNIDTIAGTGEKQLPKEGQTAKGKPILGPRALAISGSTMWIALREGNSIWNLDLKQGALHHAAGTGKKGFRDGPAATAEFNGPKGIALGSDGAVFIVDTENQAIRRLDPAKNTVSTVTGVGPDARGYNGDGQPATTAHLNRPHGICIGAEGSVYIGDSENHRVRRFRFSPR